MVGKCSHRQGGVSTERCSEPGSIALRWTEQIADGWMQTTTRSYCEFHGKATKVALADRGIHYSEVKM